MVFIVDFPDFSELLAIKSIPISFVSKKIIALVVIINVPLEDQNETLLSKILPTTNRVFSPLLYAVGLSL